MRALHLPSMTVYFARSSQRIAFLFSMTCACLTSCNKSSTQASPLPSPADPSSVATAPAEGKGAETPDACAPRQAANYLDVPVRYTLSIAALEGMGLPAMTVSATFVDGLEPERASDPKDRNNSRPYHSRLAVTQGETDDRTALQAWMNEVSDFVAGCDETLTNCDAAWEAKKGTLVRSTTLKMSTDQGVLATWTLNDVWPVELALADQPTNDPVVSFVLSGELQTFTVNDAHPLSVASGYSARWKAPEQNSTKSDRRSQAPMGVHHQVKAYLAQATGQELHFSDEVSPMPLRLEVDGAIVGGFTSGSGLSSDLDIVAYKNGDDPHTHKRAGKNKYKNLVMRQGFVDGRVLDWNKVVTAGTADQRSASVIYTDRDGRAVRRFLAYQAEPNLFLLKTGGKPTTHVHGDPHVDVDKQKVSSHGDPHVNEKDNTSWDYVVEELEFVTEKVDLAR